MEEIFFSIVVPTLNEAKYLPKLLSDLAKQSYRGFEVIVVDGNSEDKTVEIAKSYKSRFLSFEIIKSSKRNVSFQRNLGGKKARGKFIIFMDADNRLPVSFLKGLFLQVYKKEVDCFTTYCLPDSKNSFDEVLVKIINLSLRVGAQVNKPLALGAMIGVRRDVFKKYGGFDEKIAFGEDVEYVRRLFKKGTNFCVFKKPKYIVSFRHYQRDGRVAYLVKVARLHLKRVIGFEIDQPNEYPMGGYFGDARKK
ncbi:MAG: hypothetical protein KatS3mg088_049 [Patescibacteria group bacterium]|nr:MAG: hypothetical protein KatS3mg088_049 [Patescibacteria group bacterium]